MVKKIPQLKHIFLFFIFFVFSINQISANAKNLKLLSTSNNFSLANYLWVNNQTAEEGFTAYFKKIEAEIFNKTYLKINSNEEFDTNLAVTANCKDITVQLDSAGNVNIAEDAINDGSTGIGTLSFDTDITSFTCANIGSNNVVLTVIDDFDNSTDTCNAIVTVVDNEAPVPDVANLTAITGQCSATIVSAPTATD
ncbi:hypothetical protein ACFQZW_11260, partial [Lutibacter aestuarii]